MSIFPLKSSLTCSAVVGLGRPEVFALGADTNPPPARINSLAIGSLGILTATVSNPPVVPYGTISVFSNIIVSGPGQNRLASASTSFEIFLATFSKSSKVAICTINGLSEGLPFAA